MIEQFKNKIQKYGDKPRFLLAVSGGVDSMVLADLCFKTGVDFALAHCNFKLRGDESDADEAFVRQWAKDKDVPLFVKACDVKNQAEHNTQLAARNARYEWFLELKNQEGFDFVLTAHHLNDAIETFFINLQRGTGIKGLTGIPENDVYLRPLLDFTREVILQYARKNHLQWREDSSNASEKYLRNFIRHQIIPKFKQMNPNFENAMQKTMRFLQDDSRYLAQSFENQKQDCISEHQGEIRVDLSKIKHMETFLFRFLSPYGFTDWQAVRQLIKAQSGKSVLSPEYRLLKDRNVLVLSPIEASRVEEFYIEEFADNILEPLAFSMQLIDAKTIDFKTIKQAKPTTLYVDYDKIEFPIQVRRWQAGDYFHPLGMTGKKKLSDYFTDRKLSMTQKEKIWLFLSRGKIMWVAGRRPDERFKISPETKKILQIKLT